MKHLLIPATLLLISIIPFVLKRVKKDISQPLSAHIAQDAQAIIFVRIIIITVASSLLCWYFCWFRNIYTNNFQLVLFVLVCMLAILAGMFPLYQGKLSGRLHNIFAWTYAIILPLLVISFYWSVNMLLSQIIILLLGSYQLLCFALYIFVKVTRRYFLYFQISAIAAFGLCLLTVTYLAN